MRLLAITSVLFLFGCNTAQRKLEKTQEYLFKHPEFSSGYCAEQFPQIRDSVVVYETVADTLWGTNTILDTVLTNDTVRITAIKEKVVTKTIRRDSIIYRENRAEQERLQLGLLECQKLNVALIEKNTKIEAESDSWKGKAKKRWMWLALLIGGAAAFTAFKVFKTVKGV